MAETISRFRHGTWFIPVCLLAFAGLVFYGSGASHANHSGVRTAGMLLSFALAIVLTQRIIHAQTRYGQGFATILAAFLVVVIGGLELLAVLMLSAVVPIPTF